ncbi:MAG: Ribonuclease H [Parcubacteria group bacterium GW2011_GWA2_50_10b]|nr:MAG: Ribonuclease H [Parcubacteria group bacterium GW2011_GWA2_50_10b]
MITIYTDGSSRGNPGPGGWSAIVMADQQVREIGGAEEHTTNNRMELVATIKALGSVEENEVTLYTDSEYVMKGITLWIKGWQAKGWKTAAKKPVLNQDLWQELLMVTEGKNISWKYVAGHSGELLNERCDEIATSFADGLNIDLYDGPRNSYGHF